MPVGFNKARGKVSLARVHGSLGHLPWAALPSRSARLPGPARLQAISLGMQGLTPPSTASWLPKEINLSKRLYKDLLEETLPA